jgi:hypothetical protein
LQTTTTSRSSGTSSRRARSDDSSPRPRSVYRRSRRLPRGLTPRVKPTGLL